MSRTRSTLKLSGPARKQIVLIAALSAVAALVSGCGTAPGAASTASPLNGSLNFPAPPAGQKGYTDITGIAPAALAAILGNYGGTLFKQTIDGQTLSQAYTANITQANVAGTTGQTYAYLKLDSNGAIGNVHIEGFLALGLNGLYGLYSLVSVPFTAPNLTSYAVSLELIFALGSNNKFDPTQSRFYIKDCGFSQDVAVCSNLANDVWFGNDLGKR